MNEWDNDSIKAYARAIKKAEQQNKEITKRKEQWLNDFIDGKPVKQFDKFIYGVTDEMAS